LRLYAFGRKEFCSSSERMWNVFDTALVIHWLVDSAVPSKAIGERGVMIVRILRIFRIRRVVRTLRIFRMIRYFTAMRKMICAFSGSVQTLAAALVLVLFEIYFFSIFFALAVADHKEESSNEVSEALEERYGSITKSCYNMYLATTGGDWGIIIKPLFELDPSWFFAGLFLIYISVTVFGVLNILTSVFVESAMQSTAEQRELVVEEQRRLKKAYVEQVRDIFKQIDTDHSGEVSVGEVEMIFSDPSLHEYLEALDINADDARTMFRLLDFDGSGLIDIEEFIYGCLRLKGEAKSYDINCLIYESQRHIFKTKQLLDRMELFFKQVEGTIHKSFMKFSHELRSPTFFLTSVSGDRVSFKASAQGHQPDQSSATLTTSISEPDLSGTMQRFRTKTTTYTDGGASRPR